MILFFHIVIFLTTNERNVLDLLTFYPTQNQKIGLSYYLKVCALLKNKLPRCKRKDLSMNTEALEYFIKVYEEKSVTAAAKELYITPQGVSKTIKQLELELEAELFFRGPRGMEATEAGELLHARAKHIRYLMKDIKKEISVISGRKGVLNLIVTYSATAYFPVDFLYQFSQAHNDIQIKIREVPDESPTGKVFQDEADVGLVMGHNDFENCEHEQVTYGEVVLVVNKQHKLANRDEISIHELTDESFVLKTTAKGHDHIFVEECLNQGFTPNIVHEFGNIISAHRLVEINNFVAVSVDFVEESLQNPQLKIVKLKEKLPQNIYLVTRKRGFQSEAVSLFQHYIKNF